MNQANTNLEAMQGGGANPQQLGQAKTNEEHAARSKILALKAQLQQAASTEREMMVQGRKLQEENSAASIGGNEMMRMKDKLSKAANTELEMTSQAQTEFARFEAKMQHSRLRVQEEAAQANVNFMQMQELLIRQGQQQA